MHAHEVDESMLILPLCGLLVPWVVSAAEEEGKTSLTGCLSVLVVVTRLEKGKRIEV